MNDRITDTRVNRRRPTTNMRSGGPASRATGCPCCLPPAPCGGISPLETDIDSSTHPGARWRGAKVPTPGHGQYPLRGTAKVPTPRHGKKTYWRDFQSEIAQVIKLGAGASRNGGAA